MTDQIKAPWTPEQVSALQFYQDKGIFHPFTCPEHSQIGNLVPTVRGWICQYCDYTQDWAHSFMADMDAMKKTLAARDAWMTSAEPKSD